MLLQKSFLFIITNLFFFSISIRAQSNISAIEGNPLQLLPAFHTSRLFDEQERTFRYPADVRIHINAPSAEQFDLHKPVALVLYALPNGNTIEQTAGKTMQLGDDWHYDIQHIAAQTRFARQYPLHFNLVVAYLETSQLSWPAWKRIHADHGLIITSIVDSLKNILHKYNPFLVLNGHSGGGSFIFAYIDHIGQIPDDVTRIAFLDSDYGYEERHGQMLAGWLQSSADRYLCVLAYNDSIALYNGKPFVSPTGGTWYRTKKMKSDLSVYFPFETFENDSLIYHQALDGRVQIILRKNPQRKIYHTVQVEYNGFIHSLLCAMDYDQKDYTYFGPRDYDSLISGQMPSLPPLKIPSQNDSAISGSAFMHKIDSMTFDVREAEIFSEISTGNFPDFLRRTVFLDSTFFDADSQPHTVQIEVMPDYLSVGPDSDFCRIPMGPKTAQRIADQFRASLPTRKLVDFIYQNAQLKLEPVPYYPQGNTNETVAQFVAHNDIINQQIENAGGIPGMLVAGIKKDVVISNRISDPARPDHVVIYGWHCTNVITIQPLTNIHSERYIDYSHGIRLINAHIMVDGIPMHIRDILHNPLLYLLISDEDGIMKKTCY